MHLGEIIATYDVDLALRGETGKFEVKSPNGDIHYLTCRPRVEAIAETPANPVYPNAFLIRKVAELLADERSEANSAGLREDHSMPVSRVPFLLENGQQIRSSSPNADGGTTTLPQSARAEEICRLDLSYSESAKSEQPCAFVCVNTGYKELSGAGSRFLMTAACASYTELDAEIRKLHAQLDEICLRGKKNYYKAHAAAASA